MDLKFLVLLIVCSVYLALGLLVYVKNRKHVVNKLFAVIVFCVAVWIVGNYMVHTHAYLRSGILWGKFTFAAASLIPLSFLAFVQIFPEKRKFLWQNDLLIFSFLGISVALLSFFSSLIVVSVTVDPKGIIKPQYGPAYPFFALYFLSCLSYAFFILVKKWKRLQGVAKLQVQYVFLGTLLAGAAGSVTNLIIPLFFHTSRFSAYGPSFIIIMVGFVAHAIVRYQLMDIKLVIKKGAVYAISTIVTAGVIISLLRVIERMLNFRIPYSSLTFVGLLAFCLAVALQPLRYLIQSLVDRYFYRESYNYQHTLQQASRIITSTIDLKLLLQSIVSTIVDTMNTEWGSLFLQDGENGDFQSEAFQTVIEKRLSSPILSDNCAIVKALRQERNLLVREEIERFSHGKEDRRVGDEMGKLGCDLALPLSVKEQLVGLLLIGPKLSGDPYFQQDLELLSIMTSQAAMAINNAQLYREVVQIKEYNEYILRDMESGVITVDARQRITVFNRAAEGITALRGADVIGKKVDVLGPDLAEPLVFALSSNRLYFHREKTLSNTKGGILPVVFSTSLLQDAQGRDSGAIMVFSDLSQIKKLEQERNRAERLATVGRLAADLAHEIKTPLVAIKTFAELLPEKFTDSDFQKNFLKVATKEIDRIDSLVSQLSNLARHPPLQYVSLDLNSLLEEVLTLLSGQIEEQGIRLVEAYSEYFPSLQGDRNQLKQLFLNLFQNSIEAMPQGGRLTISTLSENEGPENGKYLEIKISDTGPGISDENLRRVFDPFFTTKERGTGLGLSICHRIVGDHKGSIGLENNKDGSGVIATVRLPLLPDKLEEKLHAIDFTSQQST
ncbi:MAG: GAF domain-containing protein [Candidatus Latescibacteria bacterium]|nr:GAF domain-containing protein [Candidatus Latescibacterota bacterium]